MDKVVISPYVRPGLVHTGSVAHLVAHLLGYELEYLQENQKCRKRELAEARQIIMTMELRYGNKSLHGAAMVFRKDHATVVHARKAVGMIRMYNKDFDRKVRRIEERLDLLKIIEMI